MGVAVSGLVSTGGQGRIRHYVAKDEPTLLEFLMHRVGLTRDEGERLVDFGAVYLERRRARSDQPVAPGQYIRVHVQPKRFPVENVHWPDIVVEDADDFIIVNKPAGIPVHATVDNRIENVLHQLGETLGVPLYITQRLDTEVGGLIVFARTPEFQRQFNRLLVERKVKKTYRALVASPPVVGRHVHFMEPAPRSPKTVSVTARPDWLECALTVISVRTVQTELQKPKVFEVEIDLETGRTHQIRAQLAALGSPILRDVLYGSQAIRELDGIGSPGIGLFSTSTSWLSEDGKHWRFELSVPWLPEHGRVAPWPR